MEEEYEDALGPIGSVLDTDEYEEPLPGIIDINSGMELPLTSSSENKLEVSLGADVVDLDSVFQEYGRSLIKEDFLQDDRLMEVVYQNLEARYKPAGVVGTVYGGISGMAGGDTGGGVFGPRDYRDMDGEDAFEIWQSYKR